MPSWPVSLTDGLYQVADADGEHYPLTMNDVPVSRFNEGWTPLGLHTGMPPFHVLELRHVSGAATIWLHDETLNFRANAIQALHPDDRAAFFAEMDAVVRTLQDECVDAPHAAIPSVVHRFEGMLPETVATLLAESINRVAERPDTVMLDGLADLGAGYGGDGQTLPAAWIERALSASDDTAQEQFDLPGHRCFRHLDRDAGRVFYRLRGDGTADRHLYVPAAKVVFSDTAEGHDPLRLLLVYYATNADRVVSLPEALDLSHAMIHPVTPPQHGLDEPVGGEPVGGEPAWEEPAREDQALEPESAEEPVMATARESEARVSYEAPLSETPQVVEARTVEAVPDMHRASDASGATAPEARVPSQNWWQRLLGLGQP